MSIEAMKQALEALDNMAKIRDCQREKGYPLSDADKKMQEAITSIRQAIAKAEKQEPVALETVYETIIHWDEGGGKRSRRELARRIVALYTSEPVLWQFKDTEVVSPYDNTGVEGWTPLYIHPQPKAGQDRHELQKDGKHPAPCAKFCEANAFNIEIRGLRSRIEQLTAQQEPKREWVELTEQEKIDLKNTNMPTMALIDTICSLLKAQNT